MAIKPPDQGFIFWPVGTGDSTTIRVDKTVYLQVDLHHMAKSDEDDETAWPVIDELIDILPTLEDTPYLSVFALTHPDQDHCRGFEEFNERVIISELWMSPRTFREFRENENLCEDAEAFHDEAMRRVKATIDAGGDPGRGHRIRIIGYDDLLKDPDFDGFPEEFLTIPGRPSRRSTAKTIPAPSRPLSMRLSRTTASATETTAAWLFQISLLNGDHAGRALLMGDLSYPVMSGGSSIAAHPPPSNGTRCWPPIIARNPSCTGKTRTRTTRP